MGYSHILFVYDDGIRSAKLENSDTNPIRNAIGDAVLEVCLSPDYISGPEGNRRKTWCDIPGMSNCVNWVDEIHYQQKQVYLWSGNCLRKISDLDDEELKDVRDLLDSEAQNRGV